MPLLNYCSPKAVLVDEAVCRKCRIVCQHAQQPTHEEKVAKETWGLNETEALLFHRAITNLKDEEGYAAAFVLVTMLHEREADDDAFWELQEHPNWNIAMWLHCERFMMELSKSEIMEMIA